MALTCVIPAYNEEATISDTVTSVISGSSDPPDVVIVVDDGSTDRTGEFAALAGATVIQHPTGTGSKAGAQTFALSYISTPLTMVLDADSTVSTTSIGQLRMAMAETPELVAACSYVVPRNRRTIWERGRYIEYLYAFGHGKQIQEVFGYPLISSGCFSMYRTDWLVRVGGWSTRTLAEDMDLTWTVHRMGGGVRFVPAAECEPIEPDSFKMMRTQLKRWSHGFIQNIRIHRKGLLQKPMLRSILGVAAWDAVVSSLFYLIVVPAMAVLFGPWALLALVIDLPAIAVPVLHEAKRRDEFKEALISLPSFFLLRLVNAFEILKALILEMLVGNRFGVYEKGH